MVGFSQSAKVRRLAGLAALVIAGSLVGCSTPHGPVPIPENGSSSPVAETNTHADVQLPTDPTELQRVKMTTAWHVGMIAAQLSTIDVSRSESGDLDNDTNLRINTGLDRIRTALDQVNVHQVVLPTADDFAHTSVGTASSAVDDSAHQQVDVHLGTDALNVYCLSRDLELLSSYFEERKNSPDRTKEMNDLVAEINQSCGYLKATLKLKAADTLTEKDVDTFQHDIQSDVDGLS